ncbi:HlyD family type I secretion periplasmic adaptor subunit [Oleispirillum naphthae]|uniref:HlyD family type I secretion periplasmic adaptor subunit n=1 Tax=Oleispirillum naphthae TaxID=2838853 RepID=UPI003082423F
MDASRSASAGLESVLPRLARRLEGPRVFLAAAAAFALLLVAWAAIAQVHRVVRVEGRIVPAGRSQQIQHLEGGIVASIDVVEGAAVKRGDLLLTIDATNAGAALAEIGVKLAGQRIRALRLSAEAGGAERLGLPPDLGGEASAATELQLFQSRREKFTQELAVYRQQVAQRTAERQELLARRTRLAAEQATAHKRLMLLNGLAARNAASQLEILDAQSREQRLATEISEVDGTLPKVASAVGEAQARIDEARARYRAEAQADLAATLTEIDRLRQGLTAQTDRVSRTDIRAPVDGVINRISVNTVGGVVKPGESIIEITPTSGPLLIEARARPRDRGELRDGLAAHIRVSAYDTGMLGALEGRVVEVSADTVADARGELYYRVVLRVDTLPAAYAGKLLAPGMTVSGDVVIGKRTVLDYLTSPLHRFSTNVFQDAR